MVEDRGFFAVSELSDLVGVSSVTIRTDLDALADRGVLRRIRGGAMAVGARASPERSFEEQQMEAAGAKAAIATEALRLIRPGMSVLLDVGTTAACVAKELVAHSALHDVTVITNGLTIALALERAVPRLQVIVTGGSLRPLQHSLVAPLGGLLLEHVHADLALIGCNGVDATAGVTNVNLPEADIKRAMIAAADEVVVLADGSKIGRRRLGKIASMAAVDTVITDSTAPEAAVQDLVALDGPRVVVTS